MAQVGQHAGLRAKTARESCIAEAQPSSMTYFWRNSSDMKAKVICNIANMKFDGNGGVDLISDDVKITVTNLVAFKNGLYSQNLLKSFGTVIERKEDEVIAAGQIDLTGSIITSTEFEALYFRKFIQCSLLVDTFVQSLWLVKDNSVCVLGSYCEIEAIKHVNSKGASVMNYNTSGKIESTTYNEQEILLAHTIHQALAKIIPKKDYQMFDELPGIISMLPKPTSQRLILGKTPLNYDHNNQNCIERAFMFLHIARNHSYLLYRLAFYVPIFECLFGDSNSKNEITHKVAERIAFYIGETPQERFEYFRSVKDAYNIRSKFIHGDVFGSSSLKTVDDLSPKIDILARKLLLKVILTDSAIFLDDKKRNEHLDKLIFQL